MLLALLVWSTLVRRCPKNTVNAPNQTPYRNLVTKVGLDSHDRGRRIVAAYLRGWGVV